jgi:hypothetical protein
MLVTLTHHHCKLYLGSYRRMMRTAATADGSIFHSSYTHTHTHTVSLHQFLVLESVYSLPLGIYSRLTIARPRIVNGWNFRLRGSQTRDLNTCDWIGPFGEKKNVLLAVTRSLAIVIYVRIPPATSNVEIYNSSLGGVNNEI